MENILQEIRYAVRMLVKTPGFTAIAILVLALGIGANTTIFSVVNAMMLEGLPYKEPDRIVKFNRVTTKGGLPGIAAFEYLEWRDESAAFEQIAAYSSDTYHLTGDSDPERITCGTVTASYFSLLGIQPLRGRTFAAEEDSPGQQRVVLVSESFWKERFGSDPEAIGRSITLNDKPYTVIGILPDTLRFPEPYKIWLPMALDTVQERGDESWSLVEVIGRLAPSTRIEGAMASINTISDRLTQKHPDRPSANARTELTELHSYLIGDVRRPLFLLFGVVGFVLLIACANVANLMLARAATREREMAIRSALGAGRWKMIRQLLVESLLLGLAGGVIGVLLAMWSADLIRLGMPAELTATLPGIEQIGINRQVLGFTLGVSLLTGVLFGIAPALMVSKPDLNKALKEGSQSTTSRFGIRSLRGWLVISEVALALILLVGAGLMVRSVSNLLLVKTGFNSERVLTMRVELPRSRYPKGHQIAAFTNKLIEQIESLPETQSASVINHTPFAGFSMIAYFSIEGHPQLNRETDPPMPVATVSEDYFRSLSIPLVEGRAFTDQDRDDSSPVAIVNQSFARRFFPDSSAVGKRIGYSCEGDSCRMIVGVVGDTRQDSLIENPRPEIYVPYNQYPSRAVTLSVKTNSDPMNIIGAIRSQVRLIDKDLPLADIKTMQQRVSESIARQQSMMYMFGAFAALALVLAGVGIYGVMAYTVSQRSREIGIRMALGADRSRILRLVIGQGIVITITGLAVGLAGAFALTRLMESLLFETSVTDAATYTTISIVLLITSLVACFIPARRATTVDPCKVMRYE